MLKIKVKANSITNLTDARYFAAREVRWIGFCLDPASENYLPPTQVHAMVEWLDGVQFAGEFPLLDALEILETAEQLNLNTIQIHRFTALEDLYELQHRVPVIQEVIVEANENPAALATWMEERTGLVEAFLLDFEKNNIGWAEHPQWQLWLQETSRRYPVILRMDFEVASLPTIMDALPLYGLALQGGAEEKVGVKAFDELDDLLDLLEISEEYAVE